ncbi:MAG: S1C family serine protease [Phenylobacterium sp.]|uniref:S1C family serine protease n=1 Tax=Phenylobacterium sp. TaxID=1871053 RepID=UPI003919BB0A
MRTERILLAAAGVIGVLILILLIAAIARGGDDAPRVRGGEGFVTAVERGQQATVMLSVAGAPGGPDAMPMGSGFVVDSGGLIVTAAHVAGGMPVVNIVYIDGTVGRAELVLADEAADTAVFRTTPSKPLQALPLADSNRVKAGEPVVLMGAPFGLTGTATSGIVSTVNRQIGIGGAPDFEDGALRGPVQAFIQTDAALTAGGSGGPLMNAGGQVIGVATARESRGAPGAGLAFAIPSNVVKTVLDRAKAVMDGTAAPPMGAPPADLPAAPNQSP